MKPFKSADEFKAFLDTAQAEHEKQGLEAVHLPTLEKVRECEHWTIRPSGDTYKCVRCGQKFRPVNSKRGDVVESRG